MIDILNCVSNANVQLFASPRASRLLPSHDFVRPSAPFLQTHILLHQMQEVTIMGLARIGCRQGICWATQRRRKGWVVGATMTDDDLMT